VTICVVPVTGDIAYSANDQEYDLAKGFFRDLGSRLEAALNGLKPTFVFVPGNHDCDFSEDQTIRDLIIDGIAREPTKIENETVVNQCVAVQANYFRFEAEFAGSLYGKTRNALHYSMALESGGRRILFNVYNTAWISQRHEVQGQLRFPVSAMSSIDSPADVVVSLFHHPYNWLESNNARHFRQHIEAHSDLILTGHEHEAGSYQKLLRPESATTEYLEGGVLSVDAQGNKSTFNAIVLDLESQKFEIFEYEWDGHIYKPHEVTSGWQDFQRNRNRLRNEFVISEQFASYLNDPGAAFTHSRKESLLLADIYVEPDVRGLVPVEKMTQIVEQPMSSGDLWHKLRPNSKTSILGDESSGKTALLKRLFLRFHSAGQVPIFVRGSGLVNCTWDGLLEVVEDVITREYSSELLERFKQIDKEKRVLLIDDYHLSSLNEKGDVELFKHIDKFFGTVVVTLHDLSLLEDLSYEGGLDNPLRKFVHYEILEFGHLLKEELIERWLLVGQEFKIDKEKLEIQTVNTKKLVDAVLGKNLLPSFPIFILIILQQLEASTNLNTSSGAHGYLYEALITRSLAKSAKRIDLDTAYNYLAEIANTMFRNKSRRLSEEQIHLLHSRYCEEYELTLRFDSIEGALIDAEMLTQTDGYYAFKYKYCYYYFAAMHLSDRIITDEGKAQLNELTRHIYKEEYANILVFLTYLSKHPLIIEAMVRIAKSLYQGVDPCDFDSHTQFVNALNDQLPRSVLVDKGSKAARKELNRTIDEIEAKRSKDEEDLDDALRVNVALKTIQVLGQILKNFPGSLRGHTKIEIAEQCAFLGLRTMRMLLKLLEDNSGAMIEDLGERVFKKGLDHEANVRRAKRFMSLIIEALTFGVIKRISGSIGAEALKRTYVELKKMHNTLPMALIDLSVKLDHFRKFPESEFDEIIKDTKNNVFPTLVMRHLLFYHFYRYPVKREIKQKYCEKLGIELRAINLLEQKRS